MAFPKAPEDIKPKLILNNFVSENIANKIKKLPTTIENIEKKYLPKIPHSLNMPKLTPVFLTKTIFKKGNNWMSSKLLLPTTIVRPRQAESWPG